MTLHLVKMDDNTVKETLAIVDALCDAYGNFASLAREFGLHPMEFWRARRERYVSPKLAKALGTWETRCRFSGDVPADVQRMMSDEARRRGISNGELLEDCWRAYRETS